MDIFSIKILRYDEPNDIQFEIKLSNGLCSTLLELYGNENFFHDFGKQLTAFPKNIHDSVVFEIGEDDRKWAYHLLINVSCYDPAGRSALKILVESFGDTVTGYRPEFVIAC